MPFKLPNNPSPEAHPHELADFMELLALFQGSCSVRHVQSYLGQIDENEINVGLEDSDEANEYLAEAMVSEIGHRMSACPEGYPFEMDVNGSLLTFKDPQSVKQSSHLYLYLLLATRLNMTSAKVQRGVDGTQLLEVVSVEVLKGYLGSTRSRTLVFGTAVSGGFEGKMNDFLKAFGEGGTFSSLDPGRTNANDGGIDVLAWVPFTDGLAGKLSVFGQCKTGTNWADETAKLNPEHFISQWSSKRILLVPPVKAFFVAESVGRSQWNGVALKSGVLFDRCRIVDYAGVLPASLFQKIQTWNEGAKAYLTTVNWLRVS